MLVKALIRSAALVLGVGYAVAAGATPDGNTKPPLQSTQNDDGRLVWTYAFKADDLKAEATFTIEPLPEGALVGSNSAACQPKGLGWACSLKAGEDAVVEIVGDPRLVGQGAIDATVGEKPHRLLGPTAKYDRSQIRPIVGPGLSFQLDDHVEWVPVTEQSTHLEARNDSKKRPGLLAGALVKLKGPWDLLLAAQFTQGSANVVDGVTFGLGWRVNRNVEFVAALTAFRGTELNQAFEREAARVVKSQKDDPRYAGFPLNASGDALQGEEDYEGFPLQDPADPTRRFFSGNPVVESTNLVVTVGFVLPVNLKSLFAQ